MSGPITEQGRLYFCSKYIIVQSKAVLSNLVRLLDDPDRSVYELVRCELLAGGIFALDELELLRYEAGLSVTAIKRIDEIIEDIHFEHLKQLLNEWAQGENPKLIEGLALLTRFRYRGYSTDDLSCEIHRFASPIWLEVGENFTILEKVQIINRFIYSDFKMRCYPAEQAAPKSFFINDVLLSGEGNDISVTGIYMLVCEFLELPVCAVEVFSKFVLGCKSPLAQINPEKFSEMLFYINAANKGLVMGGEQVKSAVNHVPDAEAAEVSSTFIIRTGFVQLGESYSRAGQERKADRCLELADKLK